jgi:hypothetical protein
MFITDRYFYPSRISDPGSNNSTKRGGEKNFVLRFFVAINNIKLKIIFFLQAKKIFLAKNGEL